jgi:hypothetical protein
VVPRGILIFQLDFFEKTSVTFYSLCCAAAVPPLEFCRAWFLYIPALNKKVEWEKEWKKPLPCRQELELLSMASDEALIFHITLLFLLLCHVGAFQMMLL